MNKVIIIGTNHSIQKDLNRNDFSNFVTETIKKYGVYAIGEEINPVTTVASSISKNLSLVYRIIEPDQQERDSLNIKDLAEIDNEIIREFGNLSSLDAIYELVKRTEAIYRLREQEWLKRINFIKDRPILVICGSSHVEPFEILLKENHFDVVIENKCWE